MRRLSQTVSSVSRLSSWGATPMRPRMRAPSMAGSIPRTRSSPLETGDTHPIMRMVELLPAPFGPRKPNASPGWTWSSMPSTAKNDPKRFVRRWPSMSGGTPTPDDATGSPLVSVAEYPARRRAGEVLFGLDERDHLGGCDREDGLAERGDVEVVLLAVRLDERVCGDGLLRHALDDDLLGGALGRDDATGLGRAVARLARLPPGAEHEPPVEPHAPHGHQVGPARPDCGHPVVPRVAEAFLGPLEREKPLTRVGGQDAVAGHVWPGRAHSATLPHDAAPSSWRREPCWSRLATTRNGCAGIWVWLALDRAA